MSAKSLHFRLVDLLESDGKSRILEEIKNFSSEYKNGLKNDDVESFLKKKALNFSRQNLSVTYLVLREDDLGLQGYFSLAVKPIAIPAKFVESSNTTKKKWSKFASFDSSRNVYVASAYLIAQLGKNYSDKVAHPLKGEYLVNICMGVVKECQHIVGGGIVFLECENQPELIKFYRENGFVEFDVSEKNNLVQMAQRI